MGWKLKINSYKIRGIPLGWEPRQKLGTIPEEKEDFPQRSLLPSYERHPNYWGFLLRLRPPNYLILAHKPPCTSEGLHNDFWTKKYLIRAHKQKVQRKYECGLSPSWRVELEKYSKTNLRLSLPKNTPPICSGSRNTQHNSQQRRKIPTYGREDEIINLRFTHGSTKFFNSGA